MNAEKYICIANKVDGFDPTEYVAEYTDLVTGESRRRLPVAMQIVWFRLKYPEGRIAVAAEPENNGFVARSKIYANFKDDPECYLAEAEAWRGIDEAKPGISPREWAQTAAIGIALRNAGFGLELGASDDTVDLTVETPVVEEPETSEDDMLSRALNTPCPIQKYRGKTLGEVLNQDANAINWLANKFTGSAEVSDAAKIICEYALRQATA